MGVQNLKCHYYGDLNFLKKENQRILEKRPSTIIISTSVIDILKEKQFEIKK